jgi:hypothetical protein
VGGNAGAESEGSGGEEGGVTMGMNLSFYIGPFLLCKGENARAIDYRELTKERLYNVRGECAYSDDTSDVLHLGPNVKMPEIERQKKFDKYSDVPVVIFSNTDQIAKEIGALARQFGQEIGALTEHFDDVSVEWGIVPGYF